MNDQQKKNLAILTLYVRSLPPGYDGFDMKWYVTEDGRHQGYADEVCQPEKMGCGTAACFAGHGPNAGIEPQSRDSWWRYVERSFGCPLSINGLGGPFNWLFHSGWPNSIDFALKRAAWLLEGNAVPEVSVEEEYDDENEEEIEVLQWEQPDGFSTFTPDWDKITQIANS
jgi:hypothetical protein